MQIQRLLQSGGKKKPAKSEVNNEQRYITSKQRLTSLSLGGGVNQALACFIWTPEAKRKRALVVGFGAGVSRRGGGGKGGGWRRMEKEAAQ